MEIILISSVDAERRHGEFRNTIVSGNSFMNKKAIFYQKRACFFKVLLYIIVLVNSKRTRSSIG